MVGVKLGKSKRTLWLCQFTDVGEMKPLLELLMNQQSSARQSYMEII